MGEGDVALLVRGDGFVERAAAIGDVPGFVIADGGEARQCRVVSIAQGDGFLDQAVVELLAGARRDAALVFLALHRQADPCDGSVVPARERPRASASSRARTAGSSGRASRSMPRATARR